jgi:hypothetical protein
MHMYLTAVALWTDLDLKGTLDREGFVVIRAGVSVPSTFKMVQRSSMTPVFNGASNDRKRSNRQVGITMHSHREILVRINNLMLRVLGRRAEGASELFSQAGCGPQKPHTDYDATKIAALSAYQVPYGGLLAVMENTTLDVWPRSHVLARTIQRDPSRQVERTRLETLRLGTGDVCIFRGDLIHAGSAYAVDNGRLHWFMSSYAIAPSTHTYIVPDDVMHKISVGFVTR